MMPAWFWEGLIAGLAVNEIAGWTECIARRLVRWSAYARYPYSPYARDMAEEWERIILDRPGQLFKLITAMRFVFAAMRVWMYRAGTELSVQVSARGAATFRVVTVGATVMFIAAAVLIQVLLIPPSPQGIGSSQSGTNRAPQASQSQIESLTSQLQTAIAADMAALAAWHCELYGRTCSGASGRTGAGPLARMDQLKYEQAARAVASLKGQLQAAEQKMGVQGK